MYAILFRRLSEKYLATKPQVYHIVEVIRENHNTLVGRMLYTNVHDSPAVVGRAYNFEKRIFTINKYETMKDLKDNSWVKLL